jgi:hypothetical protein
MSSRSQTESPGVHERFATQPAVGSQYVPVWQAESFGVKTHWFVFASHVPLMHGTPSSHTMGLPVLTQKPPMHATPLFPWQRFGTPTTQSLL